MVCSCDDSPRSGSLENVTFSWSMWGSIEKSEATTRTMKQPVDNKAYFKKGEDDELVITKFQHVRPGRNRRVGRQPPRSCLYFLSPELKFFLLSLLPWTP